MNKLKKKSGKDNIKNAYLVELGAHGKNCNIFLCLDMAWTVHNRNFCMYLRPKM